LGKLVDGDDGLPVEDDVGEWIADKHELLCDYVQISAYTRKKYLPAHGGRGGATYIDLFSGPGRAKIKTTGEFVDGGCVAAWRKSCASGFPFTHVVIGDADQEKLDLARERLERLGAPVQAIHGPANETVHRAAKLVPAESLKFAFLDPYNLRHLDFGIIAGLAKLQRVDMLVHVSRMDLQRNFDRNAAKMDSALDVFAPSWRTKVDLSSHQRTSRQAYFEYWKGLVATTGMDPNPQMEMISTPDNHPLYLLLLASRHALAHDFWKKVAKKNKPQKSFDF
jgi:three-Cys-motif partner protein